MLIDSQPIVDDPRTVPILAKSIYRELRTSGLSEKEVMAIAGELLSLLTADYRTQNGISGA